MIPSTLCVLVTILLSPAANGAIIQRDGTFTYLTPQPTTAGAGGSTSPSTTPTATTSSAPTTSPTTTTPTTSPTTTPPTTHPTSPTVTQSPTTSAALPPTSSIPSITPTTSATLIPTKTFTPPTTSATPTVNPGAANCNGLQQWQAAFAYVAGNQVIYNGQLYTAVQWTYDNAPPSHPDQWVFGGACGQPINNKANCNGVAAWQSNVAYTAGNDVTYQNHLWAAVQWTEANSPGDASGLWKDLGACA